MSNLGSLAITEEPCAHLVLHFGDRFRFPNCNQNWTLCAAYSTQCYDGVRANISIQALMTAVSIVLLTSVTIVRLAKVDIFRLTSRTLLTLR